MVLAGILSDSDYSSNYDEEDDNSTKCLDNEFPYSDSLSNAAAFVWVDWARYTFPYLDTVVSIFIF